MANQLPEGCLAFDEELSGLIDEELSPEREAEVRAHVDGCDRCALRLQELCNVDLALAGLAQPAVSPELARGLAARIAADAPTSQDAAAPTQRRRAAAPPPRRRWLGAPALARAALAAGLVLAAWLLLRGDEAVPPGPQLANEPVAPAPAPEAPREAGLPEGAELPSRELLAERPEPAAEPLPTESPEAVTQELLAEQREPVAPPQEAGAPPDPLVAEAREPGARDVLADLPVEDLAMLLELEDAQDLDVIANLELLETLVALEREAG